MSHFRDTSGTRLRHPPQPRTRRSDESRRPRARIRRPPPSAPAPSRSFFQRLLSVLKNRPMRLPDGRANLVKLKGGGHVEARDTAERERAGIASTGIASTAPRAAAVSRRAVDPVRACLRRPAAAAAHRRRSPPPALSPPLALLPRPHRCRPRRRAAPRRDVRRHVPQEGQALAADQGEQPS